MKHSDDFGIGLMLSIFVSLFFNSIYFAGIEIFKYHPPIKGSGSEWWFISIWVITIILIMFKPLFSNIFCKYYYYSGKHFSRVCIIPRNKKFATLCDKVDNLIGLDEFLESSICPYVNPYSHFVSESEMILKPLSKMIKK